MINKWVSINKLPTKSMLVQWETEDGKQDIGFYNSELKEFLTYDLISEKPITYWRKFISTTF